MILSILAIILITGISFITGVTLFPTVCKRSGFLLTCFTGLAALGIFFTFVSIWFPLAGWMMKIFVVVLTIILYLARKPVIPSFRVSWHPLLIALCLVSFLLVLVLSNWYINHPDTLNYHAQNIRWIQDYKLVPGVVNLQYHYGLQSSLFVLSALFSFSDAGVADLGFVNITVICWSLAFIISRIDLLLKEKVLVPGNILPWILLMGFMFWSYTQLRLTASSASVDFVAAIYCWLVFYVFASATVQDRSSVLRWITLVACFSVSIKYSVAPVMLIPLYLAYQAAGRNRLTWLRWIMLPALFLLPILVRNTVSSGYPLFPSRLIFFGFDWQPSPAVLSLYEDYIRAYARLGTSFDETAINEVSGMGLLTWGPAWFGRLAMPDKLLLLLIPVLMVACVVRWLRKKPALTHLPVLVTALAGSMVWFALAPDPRFGYGFLIPLAGWLLTALWPWFKFIIPRKLITLSVAAILTAVAGYTGYRLVNYFEPAQLLSPSGIRVTHGAYIRCLDMEFIQPGFGEDCGDLPVPCIKRCEGFEPRGERISDGFRPESFPGQ